jgi:hypothetical protein
VRRIGLPALAAGQWPVRWPVWRQRHGSGYRCRA